MPILSFDLLSDVPEALREHAKPARDGGSYLLDVVPATKLEQFRDANIKLTKQVHELQAQAEDAASVSMDYGVIVANRDAFRASCLEWKDTADVMGRDIDLLAGFIAETIGIDALENQRDTINRVLDLIQA